MEQYGRIFKTFWDSNCEMIENILWNFFEIYLNDPRITQKWLAIKILKFECPKFF